MADRTLNQSALVMVDIPGAGEDTVTLTTTNPYGTVIVNAVAVPVGSGRFSYVIPAEDMTVPGVWENVWTFGSKTVRQPFTVSRQPLSGLTKFDLRMEIASRISEIHHGVITQADAGYLVDETLVGGTGEYVHWWAMRTPDTFDAGRPQRVLSFNGSALELSDSFLELPVTGEEYVLMKINPREADRAIRSAIAELAPLSRVEEFYNTIAVADTIFTVPRGINAVSALHRGSTKLSPSAWDLLPGRQIEIVDGTEDETIGIIGLRDAGFPVWEDSIVETDEAATIARAALHLHAHRAFGAALDPEEHLRRQLAAQDEFERAKRTSVGRIPPGTRPVLE